MAATNGILSDAVEGDVSKAAGSDTAADEAAGRDDASNDFAANDHSANDQRFVQGGFLRGQRTGGLVGLACRDGASVSEDLRAAIERILYGIWTQKAVPRSLRICAPPLNGSSTAFGPKKPFLGL
eukprot:CAMPEP_0175047196 /NCGR_PEP_ID=MMETSP0052_2-20121109/5454_1 /TAXON_ID=51329 ORGANISM="Polytomella parva, Strain SAG 63-3" /NCGR_SAMPLE_ID=MMETSP0052_2 /ASSEMBLY_ACC=CAM_ASM_000194 /LENGTH=124 /DNA_ID=CAMNT_0016311031 /DNA_START=165 /DNA_END=538 /DNA_ORIENTATION=-